MTDPGDDAEALHVLDLPQLYSKPSFPALQSTLDRIALDVPSWDRAARPNDHGPSISPAGLPAYLTSIIASPLAWIDDVDEREQIWDLASKRLTERSGRSAMQTMSRSFRISTNPEGTESTSIRLNEPSMTSDNLGLKTWAASYLLSKRLAALSSSLPKLDPSPTDGGQSHARVLELGSGTGLVGIAAAAVWGTGVHLTDLLEIEPNLAANVEANRAIIEERGGAATTGILDWSDIDSSTLLKEKRYPVILAADPLYSPEHPKMLVDTILRCLKDDETSRVIVESPIREAYVPEVDEFRYRMQEAGLEIIDEGEEVGYDDWSGQEGHGGLTEVLCWWGVWRLRQGADGRSPDS